MMNDRQPVLTWLHFADLHAFQGTQEMERVLQPLWQDLRYQMDDGLKPDFIFFAGDITSAGFAEGYEWAKQLFFEPLMQLTELGKDRLFIVPGNHDVDWNRGELPPKDAGEGLRNYAEFIERFYRDGVGTPNLPAKPPYHYSCPVTIGGHTVAVVGLDSASHSAFGPEQGPGPRNSLKQGELDKVLREIGQPDLGVCVVHHPLVWFTEQDRRQLRERLRGSCQFLLHGHWHASEFDVNEDVEAELISIAAGAVFGARGAQRSYVVGQLLDWESRKVRLQVRTFKDLSNVWVQADERIVEPGPPREEIKIATRALADAHSRVDLLQFKPYAQALADFVKNSATETPITVAIDGPWGTGKTTLMHMIERELNPAIHDADDEPASKRTLREWFLTFRSRALGFTRKYAGSKAFLSFWSDVRALIRNRKGRKRFLTVWFDAWKYDQEESLWAALILEILSQVREQSGLWRRFVVWWAVNDSWRMLLRILWGFAKSLLYIALVTTLVAAFCFVVWPLIPLGVTNDLKLLWDQHRESFLGGAGIIVLAYTVLKDFVRNAVRPFDLGLRRYLRGPRYKERVGFLAEFQQDFAKVVKVVTANGKWPLVVFIDDLDRCAPPKPVEIFEAINKLIGVPHCVIVLGMDSPLVASSIEAKYGDVSRRTADRADPAELSLGQRFLEKIVQVSLRVPIARQEVFESFANTSLGAASVSRPVNPAPDEVRETELLLTAEQRTGKTLEQSVAAVRSDMPNLSESAIEQARQEVFVKSFEESPVVRQAIREALHFLGHNPRKIKRFINTFRLRAFIANRLGLLASGQIALSILAKEVIIETRWPAVIEGLLAEGTAFVGSLQATRTRVEIWERKAAGDMQIEMPPIEAVVRDARLRPLAAAPDLMRLLDQLSRYDEIERLVRCARLS